MKQIKLFSLSLLLMLAVFSCNSEKIDFAEEQTQAGPQGLDPNNMPGTLLCTLDCPYGGFRIKVYELLPGVIRYNYHPMNNIYVDHAYHTANFPTSSTNNPYTFDYFVLNNTVNSPSSPWKDVNGNVIMGGVYAYRLKNPQCLSYFNTNALYGVSNPCDLNTALLHLNQASRKPASNCGNPNIICPAPPISSIPYVTHKPFKIPPAFNIYYGYDCTPTSNGVCFLSRQVGPDDIGHPAVGPISFQYKEELNSMQVNLWRDPNTTELEIYGSNTLLNESIIQYYQLEPESRVLAGTYEIIESEYGYGYVMLELDN